MRKYLTLLKPSTVQKFAVSRRYFRAVSYHKTSVIFHHLSISKSAPEFLIPKEHFQERSIRTMSKEGEGESEVQTVKEGQAEVLLPKSVFYNPVQEFNRDITIATISKYAELLFDERREKAKKQAARKAQSPSDFEKDVEEDKSKVDIPLNPEAGKKYENGLRILEGLAASGLRSMRFGLEIPGVNQVIANDFDQNAVNFIKRNIENNKLEDIVTASYADASMLMYQHRKHSERFDVIDLDPYGSPTLFLDGAVQAVKDGGLLCVTCTDTAVLCGNAGETCFAKYGAMSLKGKFCHEMALRIVLQAIEAHANRYSRYIVPFMSISVDFYVRVFVRVYTGQGKVKESVSKKGMVYLCSGCGAYAIQRLGVCTPTKGDNFKYLPATGPPVSARCEHCGFKHHIGGPIWAEKIHDRDFVDKLVRYVRTFPDKFGTSARIIGMTSLVLEELENVPLYYVIDALSNVVHCTSPSLVQIRSAVLNAGYEVSLSHAAKNSLKTNAPVDFIWDVIRCWVKDHPVKAERLTAGSPAKAILSKEPTVTANFELHPDANPASRKKGLLRWQANPEPEWGPKARAKKSSEDQVEKRDRLQNKRKAKKDGPDLKQFACKRYKEDKCDLGDACRYSHDGGDCQSGEENSPQPQDATDMEK